MTKAQHVQPTFHPAYPLKGVIADFAFNTARSEADYAKDNEDMRALARAIESEQWPSPLIISTWEGKSYLDAGFRRFVAAGRVNRTTAPALVYERPPTHSGRRVSNAQENAYTPPDWKGRARTAIALEDSGFTVDEISTKMILTKKYVADLMRAYRKLEKLCSDGVVPNEALDLGFDDAVALNGFSKGAVEEAWNYYVENGEFPDREKQNSGGGRPPKGNAWGKKKGLAKLAEEPDMKWLYWDMFAKNFPPRDAQAVTWLAGHLRAWRDGELPAQLSESEDPTPSASQTPAAGKTPAATGKPAAEAQTPAAGTKN